MRSDFELFLKDPYRKDKYKQAVRLLEEAGIHHILLELSSAQPVPHNIGDRFGAAASNHFENLGYQKCISDLFSLEELAGGGRSAVQPDFGAIESMLEDGDITPEQAELLRGK